ncbi:MAG TPA: ATP-grasp domain-containing protein [Yaniella sp.]
MRIIISSAGRRVYLVQWFRQALYEAGIQGDVIVLDYDPNAATAAAADDYRPVPAFTSPAYADALLELIDELQPDLFISLNDHELTALSEGLADKLRARGVVTPVLDQTAHRAVADKLVMSQVLQRAGISTPPAVLLSDVVAVYKMLAASSHIIVKDRWGSGSSGLRRFTADQAYRWVEGRYANASDEEALGFDAIIVQPDVGGQEFGLDVVTAVRGGPVEGVLARQKLGMRHGETSSAMTVKNTPFIGLAAALNAALGIRGSVDVDVMLTDDGVPYVIDVNPRFGGGYPFVHVAGADVPHFYLASTLGFTPRPDWDNYRVGHIGAKHEGIIAFETAEVSAAETAPAQHERVLPL